MDGGGTVADVETVLIDPSDDVAFAAWFAVLEAAAEHNRPGEVDVLRHEEQASSIEGTKPDADARKTCLAVRDGDRVVGAARTSLPQHDNLHLVEVDLAVHPAERRRGVGRLLVTAVEDLVGEQGRTTVVGFADEPPGVEGRSTGRLAMTALGYEVAQQEVRRDIDLPLDPGRVAALECACRPLAVEYAIRTWRDRVPGDLVDDRAELSRQMSTDVPMDALDWREEVWDAARIRRNEELTRAMDRTFVGAGAVHLPTGRLVAFTDMGLARSAVQRAHQWETLVSAAHRGHRLGTLVKLAGLQELSSASPTTTVISTWNAQENAPMIAVNDALGARVNGRLAVLQRVLQ